MHTFCSLIIAHKCSRGFCLTVEFGHHHLVPQKSINLVFKSFFIRVISRNGWVWRSGCCSKIGKSEKSSDKKVAHCLLSVGSTGGTMLLLLLPSVLFSYWCFQRVKNKHQCCLFQGWSDLFCCKNKKSISRYNSFSYLFFSAIRMWTSWMVSGFSLQLKCKKHR